MAEPSGERIERTGAVAAAPDGWPVAWQPVWGDADGPASHAAALAARGALALAARLPEALLAPLLSTLAALGALLGRERSRAAREFLRQALGELTPAELARRTRRAWLQLLRVTVDGERLSRLSPAELAARFDVRWSDDARRVRDSRGGCVIVSGHVGNWEAAFAALPSLGFHPAYGVAKPPKNRPLSRALQASRERWGVRVLSRKGAIADAPAILRAGGTVALIVDQRTSGKRALLAPFFGRPARCERAPAVLLKRQRVPVLFAACRMRAEPLRYELEFGEVLWPEEWARRQVEEIVERVNAGLERMILASPEQYVWIHDRYRGTPREAESGARAHGAVP